MYKSPIEVITEEMKLFYDGDVVRAVQKHDINVDKEELLKALKYDREQYDKGYADGKAAAIDELVRCKDCIYSFMSITGETVLYCDMRPSDDHLNLDKDSIVLMVKGEKNER